MAMAVVKTSFIMFRATKMRYPDFWRSGERLCDLLPTERNREGKKTSFRLFTSKTLDETKERLWTRQNS